MIAKRASRSKEPALTAKRLKELLAARGLRATRQRIAVARALSAAGRPVGVKELERMLGRDGSDIGVATIYRTLSVLAEAGVVRRQPSARGRDSAHYVAASPTAASSGQVVCSRCGKIERIESLPEFAQIRGAVSRQSQFATTEQSLYIIADCRNEQCD